MKRFLWEHTRCGLIRGEVIFYNKHYTESVHYIPSPFYFSQLCTKAPATRSTLSGASLRTTGWAGQGRLSKTHSAFLLRGGEFCGGRLGQKNKTLIGSLEPALSSTTSWWKPVKWRRVRIAHPACSTPKTGKDGSPQAAGGLTLLQVLRLLHRQWLAATLHGK